MPRKRRRGKERRGELTGDEFWELSLGPPSADDVAFTSPHSRLRSAFESPFLRRAAWLLNRTELLAGHNPGTRPWGYWEYEVGEQPQEGDEEALRRLGLLEPWEAAQLAAWAQIRAEGEDQDA